MKKLLFLVIFTVIAGCEIENYSYYAPIMITNEPQSVLTNSATLGGRVLGEGGKEVTEFGVVWGKELPLDINVNKAIEGERLGSFSNTYKFLEANTNYYYSAYGVNEEGVGYGQIFEFKTSAEPSCIPERDNYIDFGETALTIRNIYYTTETGFSDGNMEFTAHALNSALFMEIGFNETDRVLPLKGEYQTIIDFDNQSEKSNTEVRVKIFDYGLRSIGGGRAPIGQKLYIENVNDEITFIFCDFIVGDLVLNGKCTYLR